MTNLTGLLVGLVTVGAPTDYTGLYGGPSTVIASVTILSVTVPAGPW